MRRWLGSIALEVWGIGLSASALLLAVASRYGFHRDEFYFVVAGRRLDWGYVDQPPFVPFIARITETTIGLSPTALRIVPALSIGIVAVLASMMARRMGGGRRAQAFAAFAAAWSGVSLAVGHLLATVTFDMVLWSAAIYLLMRLLDGADLRYWLALGAVIGLGMLNKNLMAALGVALVIGIAASSRHMLASFWPWAGAAIALLIAAPNLIWQASNAWPQFEMAEALAARSDGPVAYVLEQVGLLSIAFAVPAVIGWWRLLRSPSLERYRPIGVAGAALFAAFLLTGGKSYYMAPMYPVLLAAGSLWFEDSSRRQRTAMAAAGVVGAAIGLLISLPLLPEGSMSTFDATGELGETVGWPELVQQVDDIYLSIPENQRHDAAIFTASYGEAGAIDVLGPDVGLPHAVSGHNTYWLWGPPEQHGPVIGVGPIGDVIARICPDVEQVGAVTNPWGVENEEFGTPLFLCLAPDRQLADIWDDVRHYN